jgi:hypothetical protein
MKRVFTLSAVLAFCLASYAQVPFKVISVNGEIIATKANVTLQNGVEVQSDDNFDFRRPNSRAAMINSEVGRVVLTEQNAADAFARAAFAPAMSAVSARSGSVTNMAELQNIFSDKVVIFDKLEVKVGAEYFPMDQKRFFFIRYTHNNETINKRLAFKDDVLIINKDELFVVDGQPLENIEAKQLSLYYYKPTEERTESVLINSFEPIFVVTQQIKPEIQVIVDEFKGEAGEKVLAEVYDYLTSFYGKVDRENLEAWLKREFKL